MNAIKLLAFVSLVDISALVASQTFEVSVTVVPEKQNSEVALRKNMAAPLELEGAAPKGVNEKSPGVMAAAKKIISGYTYKTGLQYTFQGAASSVSYEIPDLSSSRTSPACQYFDGTTYFERFESQLAIYSDNRSNRFYTPFDQFVYLNRPSSEDADKGKKNGKFFVQVPSQWNWRLEWARQPHGQIQIDAFVVHEGQPDLHLRHALVAADRSSGSVWRYLPGGALSTSEIFTRLSNSPPAFDFAKSYPSGLMVRDYRRDPKMAVTYTWHGKLPSMGELATMNEDANSPIPGGNTFVRYLASLVGVLLVGLFVRNYRKQRLLKT